MHVKAVIEILRRQKYKNNNYLNARVDDCITIIYTYYLYYCNLLLLLDRVNAEKYYIDKNPSFSPLCIIILFHCVDDVPENRNKRSIRIKNNNRYLYLYKRIANKM